MRKKEFKRILLESTFYKLFRFFFPNRKRKEPQKKTTSFFHGNNRLHNYTIGDHSYVSFNSIVYNCTIGNYCSIGPNVVIGYGDHPYLELSTSPFIYLNENIFTKHEIQDKLVPHFKRVNIKNDVWIGANVYIKNGITIGNGAIVGAGSVVLRDVKDFEIVGGVPARHIKMRFESEIIHLLSKTEWWELDLVYLQSHKDLIENPNKSNLVALLKALGRDEN